MNLKPLIRLGTNLRNRSVQVCAMTSLALAGEPAFAQYSGDSGMFSGMINMACSVLKPLVGSNSKIVSLLFLIVCGIFVVLWMLNENKEGMVVWFLRTAVAIGILINLFTLPPLLGMASVC